MDPPAVMSELEKTNCPHHQEITCDTNQEEAQQSKTSGETTGSKN